MDWDIYNFCNFLLSSVSIASTSSTWLFFIILLILFVSRNKQKKSENCLLYRVSCLFQIWAEGLEDVQVSADLPCISWRFLFAPCSFSFLLIYHKSSKSFTSRLVNPVTKLKCNPAVL